MAEFLTFLLELHPLFSFLGVTLQSEDMSNSSVRFYFFIESFFQYQAFMDITQGYKNTANLLIAPYIPTGCAQKPYECFSTTVSSTGKETVYAYHKAFYFLPW